MDKILENNIVTEMSESFIDYSMSVIVSRALPDLRDGLKPVHRRILWGMFDGGVTPDKGYRKSARTVGDVMGKYHPHGDSSIYDAMVRMAQEWSYRHTLVDGQGNFGNQDGDGAAAMRYTEAKLSKIAMELLRDINKDTVDFEPNFDGLEKEPKVIPSRFPNVLVNGSMGIAVGMATNIPPHNLGEVIDGCVAYINNNDITIDELMNYIKGPDFPTGGIILGNSGIRRAYETGKGSITLRGKATIEEHGSKTSIVVTQIPYMVNTDDFQERVGRLINEKVLDGIADIENISSRPLKFNIVLKRDANPNVVLNNLYKHTQLQVSYGINLLLIDQNQPKTLNLKEIISKYIDYQIEVITRRTRFELAKAESRIHILEGFKIALDHMDEVIKLIRASKTDQTAKEGLMEKFALSEIQSDAILEMKLRRLTGLEREKIENEFNELIIEISRLKEILADHNKILEIIKQELLEIKAKYSDARRSEIDNTSIEYIEDESLIPVENVVIALTNKGYIKRMLIDTYRSQNRGGVGIKGMTTNEEDFVEKMISMRTHDYILFFSNVGRVYRIKGYEIPEYSRQSKGLPLVNLLPLEKNEYISSIVITDYEKEDSKYLVFITKCGLIKRTNISEYENIRKGGKIAILLKENDQLIAVRKTSGENEIIICASNGRMVRFVENEVRPSGRNTSGVRGIDVDSYNVVGAEIVTPEQQVLILTEKGYGKKTYIEEYRLTHRGSKGVKALNITEKNGSIVSFKSVNGNEDLMIITDSGIIIRIPVEQISTLKRNTQGVRLINLKDNQKVATIAIVEKSNEEEIVPEE